MSRSFYFIAGALLLFALIAGGMAMVPSSFQPGLPANASLWRTIGLIFLLAGLAFAFVGVMTNLFEQVDRRSEEARIARRRSGRSKRE